MSYYKPNLPSSGEYLKGVSIVMEDKGIRENINFEMLNTLLLSLGITENPYSFMALENFQKEKIQEFIVTSFEKLKNASAESIELAKQLWDYLSEEDPVDKAELIFVFGGTGENRVLEAVKYFNQGLSDKILFTGAHASYMKPEDNISEGEMHAALAMTKGVPAKHIIIEKNAINTPENAVNSVRILKENNFLPTKIIIITLPYHMRRSYLTLKSVIDWDCQIIRRIAPSAKYTRDNFYRDFNGWSYVFNEFIKLYGARLMGHF